MSVDCEAYIGYMVTLATDLDSGAFEFFNEFSELHDEYNLYDCVGNVVLVVDGMCGSYARFVFVDEHIEDCWISGKDYFPLKNHGEIPENVYEELNKAYMALYGTRLDRDQIEYALLFVFV